MRRNEVTGHWRFFLDLKNNLILVKFVIWSPSLTRCHCGWLPQYQAAVPPFQNSKYKYKVLWCNFVHCS